MIKYQIHLIKQSVELFGKIDFAVNVAGICIPAAKLCNIKTEDFDRLIKTNLYGEYYCMKHEVAEMLKTGGGAIVNVYMVENGLP